jgi:DNA-binding MarR family transcriptional regulator
MTELSTRCRRVASSCACLNVRQASRVISQLYDDALRPAGLRVTQFGVLVAAGATEEGMLIGELADRIVLDRTTLTRNLAVLESDGLVVIRPTPDDARARRVSLSAKGRRALERAMPLWESVQDRLRTELGADGWDRLAASLRDTVTALAGR